MPPKKPAKTAKEQPKDVVQEAPSPPSPAASPTSEAAQVTLPVQLPPASPPIVENLMAPEFFAIEAQSISLVQGMISIAFASARYDYSQTPSVLKKVVVSRIVMSPVGAQSLAVRLFAFLDQKGFGAAPKDPKQRQ